MHAFKETIMIKRLNHTKKNLKTMLLTNFWDKRNRNLHFRSVF